MSQEHIVTVESVQVFQGVATPSMAEYLTNEGEGFDRLFQRKTHDEGIDLEFAREEKVTYECSCGRRFRKPETAREHLEDFRETNKE